MQQFINHLQSISPISDQAASALMAITSTVTIDKHANLQAIGNTCKQIYFVNRGLLRVYYIKDGIDITESFEFENALVARADSLFDASPSKKGIQAIEKTELMVIDAPKLFDLYDHHHDIERLFRKIVEQAYVKTVNRIESLQFHHAEERYQNLLTNSKSIVQRVPLKFIASYLGITQVSLSRIRAKH